MWEAREKEKKNEKIERESYIKWRGMEKDFVVDYEPHDLELHMVACMQNIPFNSHQL